MVDLCKAASGEEGCACAGQEEIEVLLEGLQSSSGALRSGCLQSLSALSGILPDLDDQTDLSCNVVCRLWVARFDSDDDNSNQAKRYATISSHSTVVFKGFVIYYLIPN